MISALIAQATDAVARARVDALLALGDQQLLAIARVSHQFRAAVDENARLRREHAAILARTGWLE
jgi:hypothetical protein